MASRQHRDRTYLSEVHSVGLLLSLTHNETLLLTLDTAHTVSKKSENIISTNQKGWQYGPLSGTLLVDVVIGTGQSLLSAGWGWLHGFLKLVQYILLEIWRGP